MATKDTSQEGRCVKINDCTSTETNKLKCNSENIQILSQQLKTTTTPELTSNAQSEMADDSNIEHQDGKSCRVNAVGSPEISQESSSNEKLETGSKTQSSSLTARDPTDLSAAEVSTKSQQQQQQQAAIPENILSPPKSETQTDETATSSSPASDSQLSPTTEAAPDTPTTPDPTVSEQQPQVSQAINVVANGVIPNSGKPLMSAMNKKLNKPSSSRSTRQRKSKPLVAMYESEVCS